MASSPRKIVKVRDEGADLDAVIEMHTQDDNGLLLSSVGAVFGGATSLKFQDAASGT